MMQGDSHRIGRRAFIKDGMLLLAAPGFGALGQKCMLASETVSTDDVHIGLLTDVHYADKAEVGSRFYRESLTKLSEAVSEFKRENVATIVELGDFIDSGETRQTDEIDLQRINRAFSEMSNDRHYVLGNHCVQTLNKNEFLRIVEREQSYYSFDRGQFHFIILDACFRSDGKPYGRRNFDWTDANIPSDEIEWLQSDLKSADQRNVVVFVHQRLDVATKYGVKNADDVRRTLEQSGNVRAVVQGHYHKNDYKEINGVHYCTLRAVVEGAGAENSGYSTMSIQPDGEIRIAGFRRQSSYDWKRPK